MKPTFNPLAFSASGLMASTGAQTSQGLTTTQTFTLELTNRHFHLKSEWTTFSIRE
ncbi:MAG: hypothetical protein ACI9HK_005378 [Pirellulaceae bacterium]|jgi:hypothetical protein